MIHPNARILHSLKMLERHAARPRPIDRPLLVPEDLNSVDIAVAKAAARRLRGKP